MPEDVVAKIVIEDGSSGGGSKIPSPRQQKRDQTQESIAKNLSGVGKFFSGGEITQFAKGIGALPAALLALGKGLLVLGAVAGIAVGGFGLGAGIAKAGLNLSDSVTGFVDEDERKAREQLVDQIEAGITTNEDTDKVMDALGGTVEDTSRSMNWFWKELKEGNVTLGEFFPKLAQSFLQVIDTTASLGETMNGLRKHMINLQNDTGGNVSPVVRSGQRTYSGPTPFEQARQENIEARNPFLSSISQPEGYVSPTTLATSQVNFLIGSDRTSSFTR